MIHRHVRLTAAAAGLLFAAQPGAFAQPTPDQAMPSAAAKPLPFVSPIFSDNMVLQRGKPDIIWGWIRRPGNRQILSRGLRPFARISVAVARLKIAGGRTKVGPK